MNPSTGLYQAPSPIAGGDTITITATSVEDPKKSDTATVLLVPVAVNVTPFSASVATNQSAQFTATVDGSTNTNVTWSLGAGDPGSITQTGLYSPPNPITATATVTVTATSQADPNKSDWATVDVLFVQISMVPTSATVHVGETAEFFATATFSDINWSLGAGSPGSLSPLIVSSSSATYLYTPPASIAQDETATVIVEATTDPTRTATATVNLVSTEVSVAPSSANLQINQQQQFTAAVTGHPNTNVTWSVSPSVGAISSTGLYTAPSTLSSPQAVTVAATSVADPVKSANATVNLEPVVVSLSPSTASLQINQQQQFTATVTGNADTSVTWSLGAGNPGTISASGLYTAPASIATQQNISVIAASVADPNRNDTATVTLIPVAVAVSPASASLASGQSQQFTATVTGTSNTSVTWSISPAVGSISGTGLYTAPAMVSSSQTVTVTATSVADTNKFDNSTVTLQPLQVSVSPSTVTLRKNDTQQFTATVTFATDPSVTWSMPAGSPGTLSATGLYTAPSNVSQNNQQIPITATSVENPTVSDSGIVTLKKGGGPN